MSIARFKVENYRNINGTAIIFNPECNYIINENNLGKSKFLSLLATVCNGKGFDEMDFTDLGQPVYEELEIKLPLNEQGFFGDNFSSIDFLILNIRYKQTIKDAYLTVVCENSNESIQLH